MVSLVDNSGNVLVKVYCECDHEWGTEEYPAPITFGLPECPKCGYYPWVYDYDYEMNDYEMNDNVKILKTIIDNIGWEKAQEKGTLKEEKYHTEDLIKSFDYNLKTIDFDNIINHMRSVNWGYLGRSQPTKEDLEEMVNSNIEHVIHIFNKTKTSNYCSCGGFFVAIWNINGNIETQIMFNIEFASHVI